MSYEELMLRKYTPLLWKKTHDFLRKTALSDSCYRDDIFQESCLAFIAYLRSGHILHETLTVEEMMIVCRRIDLYLLEAFQDPEGIGLNRNTRKAYYADGGKGVDSIERIESACGREGKPAQIESIRDPHAADAESKNMFTIITAREWLGQMSADDRSIVMDLLNARPIVEVARRRNRSRQNIRTRLKQIRRSFSDYVEEHPVA